jgi:hypothetical protein
MASYKYHGKTFTAMSTSVEAAQRRALIRGLHKALQTWQASLKNKTGGTRRRFRIETMGPHKGVLTLLSWGGVVSETGAKKHTIVPKGKKALSWARKGPMRSPLRGLRQGPTATGEGPNTVYARTTRSGKTVNQKRVVVKYVLRHPGVQRKHLLLIAGHKTMPYLRQFVTDELTRVLKP